MITRRKQQAHDTEAALARVSVWLSPELRRHARDEVISAVVKLCLAAGAGVLTSALLLYFFGRIFLLAGKESFIIAVSTPPAILLLALVAQAFRSHRDHGVMQVHGEDIRFADQKTHFGDPNEGMNLDAILFFPGWLFFSAYESLAAAWRLRHAEADYCARVLAYLASEDRRVFIPDLEQTFSPKLVPNLKALVAFPGVLVSSRETPSLILSPELGAQIRDML